MVRTLFLKIFLWFWLAMALVAVSIVITTQMAQPEPTAGPGPQMLVNMLAVFAETAADTFERGGRQALAEYLERLKRTGHLRAVVFDAQGEELSGLSPPPGARELAARVQQSGKAEFRFSGRSIRVAQQAFAGHRDRYIFVAELRGSLLARLRMDPRTYLLRLIAVLMTAGVVCYGLARYLTAPITKLRRATQRLAAGDLTARVAALVGKRGDELASLGRDFDLMAERLESLVSAQRALLSDVSHELRSPLARLNVALELARQRASSAASEALDRIEREAARLNDLIEQLLTLVRLEGGPEGPPRIPVDLARLVQEVAVDADFEARSHHRGVRAVINEPCETMGRAELLRSAIENIVRNAVRYTAEGTEVEINLSCLRDSANRQAVICVRDHGPGVPEATLPDLFRPFYRVADARDRESGGTGLGLAIAERAVRVHGGRITATNASGGGLLVETYLPATSKQSDG